MSDIDDILNALEDDAPVDSIMVALESEAPAQQMPDIAPNPPHQQNIWDTIVDELAAWLPDEILIYGAERTEQCLEELHDKPALAHFNTAPSVHAMRFALVHYLLRTLFEHIEECEKKDIHTLSKAGVMKERVFRALVDQYPEYFTPFVGDETLDELLESGWSALKRVFVDPLPESVVIPPHLEALAFLTAQGVNVLAQGTLRSESYTSAITAKQYPSKATTSDVESTQLVIQTMSETADEVSTIAFPMEKAAGRMRANISAMLFSSTEIRAVQIMALSDSLLLELDEAHMIQSLLDYIGSKKSVDDGLVMKLMVAQFGVHVEQFTPVN